MSKKELNLLAIYLDRAVKTEYFANLNHFITFKDSLADGDVKTILNTLIGFMLPDLDTDIREELEEDE